MCRGHRERKAEVMLEVFDGFVANNIASYLCCHKCREMHECDKHYQQEEYNNFNKTEKQIHSIIAPFNQKYNAQKTLKNKKAYLKKLIDKTDTGIKPMLKKFVNDSVCLRTFEDLLHSLYHKKLVKFSEIYGDLHNLIYTYRRQEDYMLDVLKELTLSLFEYLISFNKNYYDFAEIQGYVYFGF